MSDFNDDQNHVNDHNNYYPFGNFYRGSQQNNFNKKILLTAIVSLALVLMLVFALHLYARFVLKRQIRRRRAAIHQLSLTVARAHTEFSEPPGLDPTIINTLPTFHLKQKQDDEQNKEHVLSNNVVECSVCLSLLEEGEIMRLLPNCKHSFHVGCIDMWLASHSTCPICRTKVEPQLVPEAREGPTFRPSESTSDGGGSGSPKSISRLSSFRRILTRDRSSRRIQPSNSPRDVDHDLERQ